MNEFERNSKQILKKNNNESTPELEKKIFGIFVKCMDQPRDLSQEIYDYCCPENGIGYNQLEKLSNMVDLFQMDYNEEYNHLDKADWVYIKEMVNDFAPEMDMDTVTYIMQIVMDLGVL